jgi:predicted permease
VTAVLAVTGPIFALIGLGYLLTRFGLFGAGDLRALGRYVVLLALPALIFRAVTARDLAQVIDPAYLAAYLGGSLLALAAGYGLSRRAGLAPPASTFQAMGVSCANSGFIGYPIMLIAMPALADSALAQNMIAENLVIIPLVLVLAERGSGGAGLLGPLRRAATNPIVLALAAGLVVALTPLAVPAAIGQAIELVARSSAAVSLVVIGGTLVGVPRTGRLGRVAAVVAGKLLLHPLAVAACFAALGLAGVAVDPAMAAAGVLMAAMPAMGVYPILAGQYGEGAPAAAAMLAMTVAAFFTIGGLLLLLGLPA